MSGQCGHSHARPHARRGGLLIAGAVVALTGLVPVTATAADEVRIGALFGVTGPIANFVPALIDAASLAIDQANTEGGVLDGRTVRLVVGDTQGAAQGAVDAATKLVNVDGVTALVGALTSGAAIAAANSVSIPSGVLQISPSATAPDYRQLDDNDVAFRVAPSDDYQGRILAKLVRDQGIGRVALTYVNNDYGAGTAETFRIAFTAAGGTITADQAHEPNKSSYRSELATLAGGNPDALVVIAYAADSGITIIRQSLENGFFDRFIGTDGLRDDLLIQQIGAENLAGSFFTAPTAPPETAATEAFATAYGAAYDTSADKLFAPQTYDATMLALLAIEKAGSTDRAAVRAALRDVANAPGEVVGPGDWAKAKALIAEGKDIDYVGASGPIEFDGAGDVAGVIGHFVIEDDGYRQVGIVTE